MPELGQIAPVEAVPAEMVPRLRPRLRVALADPGPEQRPQIVVGERRHPRRLRGTPGANRRSCQLFAIVNWLTTFDPSQLYDAAPCRISAMTEFAKKRRAPSERIEPAFSIEQGGFGGVEEIMNSGPTLSIGSTGPDVRRLQIIFVMTKELDVSDIDSNFGPKTRDAVKSFQQGNNLTPDGVVGPMTWQALPTDPNTPRLVRGSTGPAVSALQKGLKSFDGPNTPTDPGPIDGNFGQRTESAVRAYQTRQSISVDGVAGDQTWWVPAGAAGATLAKLAGLVTA